MKRFPLMLVVALLGATVSAPAQSNQGRFGRAGRGQVVVASQPRQVEARQPRQVQTQRTQQAPQTRQPIRSYGGRRAPARHEARVTPVHQHGYWETHYDNVLVPGYWDERHVPATYGWVFDVCGVRVWGIVDPGGCQRVWVPARWEQRPHRIWVSGHVGGHRHR